MHMQLLLSERQLRVRSRIAAIFFAEMTIIVVERSDAH